MAEEQHIVAEEDHSSVDHPKSSTALETDVLGSDYDKLWRLMIDCFRGHQAEVDKAIKYIEKMKEDD